MHLFSISLISIHLFDLIMAPTKFTESSKAILLSHGKFRIREVPTSDNPKFIRESDLIFMVYNVDNFRRKLNLIKVEELDIEGSYHAFALILYLSLKIILSKLCHYYSFSIYHLNYWCNVSEKLSTFPW